MEIQKFSVGSQETTHSVPDHKESLIPNIRSKITAKITFSMEGAFNLKQQT